MSKIKAKHTKPELILRKALWHNGLKGYRLHWKKASGKPDIAYIRQKLAIFVNGCFWHRCPYCNPSFPKSNIEFWKNKFKKNIERDIVKISELQKDGWNVLVFWECQIKNNLMECIQKVHKYKEKKV